MLKHTGNMVSILRLTIKLFVSKMKPKTINLKDIFVEEIVFEDRKS